jgi:hypothetical protein
METRGIAGSVRPERAGVFLCSDLGDAGWFAAMVHGEPADIWRVRVDGLWLVSDPGASGGLDEHWMITTDPLPKPLLQRERGKGASNPQPRQS